MTHLHGLPGGPPYRPSRVDFIKYEGVEKFSPMKPGERGIILWSGLQIFPDGRTIGGIPLDSASLRSSLLLFDRIDWPWNDVLAAPTSPDEEFLINTGIMRRSCFSVSGGDFIKTILKTNLETLNRAEQSEPGQWGVLRPATQERSFESTMIDERGLSVRLAKCIPVPDKDVPLHDILEFKTRRYSELKALQYHLDKVYQEIISSPDQMRAADSEISNLDRAIKDHLKVSREARFKKILTTLETEIDLGGLFGSTTAAVSGHLAGLPMSAALLGGLASFSVSLGISLKRKSATPGPFEYIVHYHDELF